MIDCTLSEEEVNPGVDLVKRQIGKRWATRRELFPHIYAGNDNCTASNTVVRAANRDWFSC
jgi:hypothetical protein